MSKLFAFPIILAFAISCAIFCPAVYTYAEDHWQEGARLSVKAVIEPFTFIKLSANSIVFNITGEPGEYPADKDVGVTVGSNSSAWSVKAMATPLVGENGEIPASRISLMKEATGKGATNADYTDMAKPILLAEGTQTLPTLATNLKFKLKTTWEDSAGTYDGEIIFVYLATP